MSARVTADLAAQALDERTDARDVADELAERYEPADIGDAERLAAYDAHAALCAARVDQLRAMSQGGGNVAAWLARAERKLVAARSSAARLRTVLRTVAP